MILFKPFFLKDANESNAYIIGCREAKQALLIDAGEDSPDYDVFLESLDACLAGIFLTHAHWDHDGGLLSILARHNVPVYSKNGRAPNGKPIREGDRIPLGRLNAQVFQTTGHTPDSMTLIVENRFAFVGDALFAGSIGGTSSAAMQEEEQNNIRRVLFSLPDETLICPGHGPITTVGIEKNCNPFFV
ncbi:MAG: MBL fold metallo-hydrolase [Candidatus Omnitrophica bacterium]|nr:MBL fold metallo-hydrolase [Candidatus Omnitrophota bacterium]